MQYDGFSRKLMASQLSKKQKYKVKQLAVLAGLTSYQELRDAEEA